VLSLLRCRRDGSRRVNPPALQARRRRRRRWRWSAVVEIDEVKPTRQVDLHERVRRCYCDSIGIRRVINRAPPVVRAAAIATVIVAV
jgi:hypothetical protein